MRRSLVAALRQREAWFAVGVACGAVYGVVWATRAGLAWLSAPLLLLLTAVVYLQPDAACAAFELFEPRVCWRLPAAARAARVAALTIDDVPNAFDDGADDGADGAAGGSLAQVRTPRARCYTHTYHRPRVPRCQTHQTHTYRRPHRAALPDTSNHHVRPLCSGAAPAPRARDARCPPGARRARDAHGHVEERRPTRARAASRGRLGRPRRARQPRLL